MGLQFISFRLAYDGYFALRNWALLLIFVKGIWGTASGVPAHRTCPRIQKYGWRISSHLRASVRTLSFAMPDTAWHRNSSLMKRSIELGGDYVNKLARHTSDPMMDDEELEHLYQHARRQQPLPENSKNVKNGPESNLKQLNERKNSSCTFLQQVASWKGRLNGFVCDLDLFDELSRNALIKAQ